MRLHPRLVSSLHRAAPFPWSGLDVPKPRSELRIGVAIPRSPPPPPQSILDRLRNMMRNEEIFSLFHTYFPEESARDDVYLQFGQAAPLSGWQSMKHAWWYGADASRKARIDMGKQMVSNAPALLVPHLIRKIEQQNVTPSS
jgi:hypothetical protein